MSTPVAGSLATIPVSVNTATDDLVWWNDAAGTWELLLAGGGSGFLPISGGTITGNLAVTGTLAVTGATTLHTATATTPATADNSTNVATTAFVKAQGYVTGGPYVPIAGGVTVTGALTVNGLLATATGLEFLDRGTGPAWEWYAQGGVANLWNASNGAVVNVNTLGGITATALNLTGGCPKPYYARSAFGAARGRVAAGPKRYRRGRRLDGGAKNSQIATPTNAAARSH